MHMAAEARAKIIDFRPRTSPAALRTVAPLRSEGSPAEHMALRQKTTQMAPRCRGAPSAQSEFGCHPSDSQTPSTIALLTVSAGKLWHEIGVLQASGLPDGT